MVNGNPVSSCPSCTSIWLIPLPSTSTGIWASAQKIVSDSYHVLPLLKAAAVFKWERPVLLRSFFHYSCDIVSDLLAYTWAINIVTILRNDCSSSQLRSIQPICFVLTHYGYYGASYKLSNLDICFPYVRSCSISMSTMYDICCPCSTTSSLLSFST